MTFPVTFLTARTHLGKTFADEGARRPPHARNFTSVEYELTPDRRGIETLAKLVQRHTGAGDAFFTGKFVRPLLDESRAGLTDRKFKPQVLVVDLDSVALDIDMRPPITTERLVEAARQAQQLLPEGLAEATCVAHASSSFALKPGHVSIHLFFMLDAPFIPGQMKAWLAQANFEDSTLQENLDLNPTGMSLHFPLDRCLGENSRLLYIAAPQFESKLLKDPFENPVDRVVLVDGKHDIASISDEVANVNPQTVDDLIKKQIEILRKQQGLRKRTSKLKTMETRKGDYREVLTNPDQVSIEIAYERDPFVYANFNGGDSNAYYWPKDNPRYIYNFKDEPVVEMAKVAPDFHRDYLASLATEVSDIAETPLVIRDRAADRYLALLYNGTDQTLMECNGIQRGAVDDFMRQYGGMEPDLIETWTVHFDPKSLTQLDSDRKILNTFTPSIYMQMEADEELKATYGKAIPIIEDRAPAFTRLLLHIAGNARMETEHFLNWLAFVFQVREKTSVAWIFHGVEGTGKGILFNEVLHPLFGERYATSKKINDLEDSFNGWREQALLVAFDEFRMADAKEGSRVYDRLKNMISEPIGTVRAMQSNQKDIRLHENLIFFSNSQDALKISATDRRFCVPPAQHTPVNQTLDTRKLVAELHQELPTIARFLVSYEVDEVNARLALETEAKASMRNASNTWVEDYCDALEKGRLEWFVDNILNTRPTGPDQSVLHSMAGETIARICLSIMRDAESIQYLSIDDAMVLFQALDGGKATKIGFSKLVARYGLDFQRRRIEGERNRFLTIHWDTSELNLGEIITTHGDPNQQASAREHLTH